MDVWFLMVVASVMLIIVGAVGAFQLCTIGGTAIIVLAIVYITSKQKYIKD